MADENEQKELSSFQKFKNRAEDIIKNPYFIAFFVVLGWLLIQNWEHIQNPPDLSTRENIKIALLTPVNRQILIIGSIYALVCALFFLFRLPFLDMEQFKFFGLEYKLKAEKEVAITNKAVEVANNTLQKHIDMELARLGIIQYLHNPVVERSIKSFYVNDDFKAQEAFELLGSIFKNFYEEQQDVIIQTGFILAPNNNQVDSALLIQFPPSVQKVVQDTIDTQSPQIGEDFKVAAIPLLWDAVNDSFIFYIKVNSGSMIIDESDISLMDIAWTVMKSSMYVNWCEQELDKARG